MANGCNGPKTGCVDDVVRTAGNTWLRNAQWQRKERQWVTVGDYGLK